MYMNFSTQIDVTWFNFTQMPTVVVSENPYGNKWLKLHNASSNFEVYRSGNTDTDISSGDELVAQYNKKTGELLYVSDEYSSSIDELNYTFNNYSSWYNPTFNDKYGEARILIAFTFHKVNVEKTELKGRYFINGGFPEFNKMTDSYGKMIQYGGSDENRFFYIDYNGDFIYETKYKKVQTGYSFYCKTPIRITDYDYSFLGMTPIVQNGRCYGVLSYSDDIVLQHITIKDTQDVVRQIVNGNMIELINYSSLSQTYSYNGYQKTFRDIAVRGIMPVFSCYFDKTTSKIVIERTENCDGVLMQLYLNDVVVDETLGNVFNINKKGIYSVSNKQVDVLFSIKINNIEVDYTNIFVISTDDAMLAINNPDGDIESVDLYCDGVFVANVK